MIPDETRSKIRQLFFGEHWKVGTIAAQLGVHHEAVRNAIDAQSFMTPEHRVRAEMLDPYRDFVRATLEKYPKLCSTRLLEMVKGRGYEGSVYPLRRFVARERPKSRHEAFFRLSTLPGEQAQVDWASFGTIRVGGATRKLYLFIMVLAWSRAIFARFYLDQTTATFLAAHVAAFHVLGGVPRSILYDNLKSVVLERDGDLVRFHPRILELAGHYHFAPKPCAVARGNEKGRVERRIRDVRESFFAARTFHSLADLNAQLDRWVEGVQRGRLVPGDAQRRTVRDAHAEEKKRLLPMPEHPFPTDHVQPIASGRTPYVRYDRNDYSIPHDVVKKPLTLVASENTVRLLDGAREIARHQRSFDAGQQIEDEAHLRALAAQKRKSREHRGRNRLCAVCPAAHDFLASVALHGGHLGGTTARLLRLLDEHGAAALDIAVREAIARGAFRAESVAHVLDQRRRATGRRPAANLVVSADPRVRDQVVEPHRLEAYDGLASIDDDNDDDEGADEGGAP